MSFVIKLLGPDLMNSEKKLNHILPDQPGQTDLFMYVYLHVYL